MHRTSRHLTSTNPSVQFTGAPGSGVAAVSALLADPSGFVYVDSNGNGRRETDEVGIANVLITLSGLTNTGVTVNLETRTDNYGFYQFDFLAPGVYSVFETQPAGYLDGAESVGNLGARSWRMASQTSYSDAAILGSTTTLANGRDC
ncbi:MAG: hypothetical protein KDB23_16505 [Planctomycetales bacterium]|nr:hypothetical protein [Planctomycetales bacterium]